MYLYYAFSLSLLLGLWCKQIDNNSLNMGRYYFFLRTCYQYLAMIEPKQPLSCRCYHIHKPKNSSYTRKVNRRPNCSLKRLSLLYVLLLVVPIRSTINEREQRDENELIPCWEFRRPEYKYNGVCRKVGEWVVSRNTKSIFAHQKGGQSSVCCLPWQFWWCTRTARTDTKLMQ
jgi:hypothetical protein